MCDVVLPDVGTTGVDRRYSCHQSTELIDELDPVGIDYGGGAERRAHLRLILSELMTCAVFVRWSFRGARLLIG